MQDINTVIREIAACEVAIAAIKLVIMQRGEVAAEHEDTFEGLGLPPQRPTADDRLQRAVHQICNLSVKLAALRADYSRDHGMTAAQ